MRTFSKRRNKRKSEESWQIIYVDLLTNVMIFFLVLWTISQGKGDGISHTIGDTTSRMINLPGDVLFPSGRTNITPLGKSVFKKLFSADDSSPVLNFESSNLTKRVLMIHGHTDSDGKKDKNLMLGFDRAYQTYKEISRYSPEISEHVVICSHADNTPEQEVPSFQGSLSPSQKALLNEAKSKNRRISIEDRTFNTFESDGKAQ